MRMPQPHRKGHRHVAYAMQRCNLELTLHPAATVSHIAIAAVVMNPNLAAAFLATTLAVNLSFAGGKRRGLTGGPSQSLETRRSLLA
uniref:Uncharacterized protein n=1 Tax=Oryza sativa subsp. japonica TaxID=39947 RepID=Q8W387_ORYSJ|nr:hypothetical protein [Oryza sativa Japonica Group]